MNPETQQLIQTVLMRTMLVSMMFAMGLRLTVSSLAAIVRQWGLITWVLIANFVIIPVLAYLLVTAFGVGPQAAAGIVICASAPGSTVATLLSRNARGDVPTAVALLLVLVFSSLIATPFIVGLLLSQLDADVGSFTTSAALQTIFLYQLVPLIVGMVFHHFNERWSARLEPWMAGFATLLLVIVVVGFTIAKIHLVGEIGWAAGACIACLIAISFVFGGGYPQPRPQRISTAFASGSRNIALSILLAETYLTDDAVLSVMIFGLLTYLLLLPATPLAGWWVMRGREPAT